jgi:hypothetical protein
MPIADGCPVTVTGGPFVLGLFAQQGVENAFMIMNRNYQAKATATLALRLGKGKLMAFSVSQRRWVEAQAVENGSRVEVDLPPGGRPQKSSVYAQESTVAARHRALYFS